VGRRVGIGSVRCVGVRFGLAVGFRGEVGRVVRSSLEVGRRREARRWRVGRSCA